MIDFILNNIEFVVGAVTFILGWAAKFISDKAKEPGKDFWNVLDEIVKKVDSVDKKVNEVKDKQNKQ